MVVINNFSSTSMPVSFSFDQANEDPDLLLFEPISHGIQNNIIFLLGLAFAAASLFFTKKETRSSIQFQDDINSNNRRIENNASVRRRQCRCFLTVIHNQSMKNIARNRTYRGKPKTTLVFQSLPPPPLPKHNRRGKRSSSKKSILDSHTSDNDSFSVHATKELGKNDVSWRNRKKHGTKKKDEENKNAIKQSLFYHDSILHWSRVQKWDEVIQRAQYYPLEARQRDFDYLLPIHWACSGGAPVSVIRALLRAYPPSAKMIDFDHSTPLHFACCYGVSISVMKELLKAYPNAVKMRDIFGRTPLYHACEESRTNYELLKLLLSLQANTAIISPVNSVLITKSYHVPKTPLALMWRSVLEKVTKTSSQKHNKYNIQEDDKDWNKALLLSKAAYLGSINQSNDFQILHAIVYLRNYIPHAEVFDIVIDKYPDQVMQRESKNYKSKSQLPLHMATASASTRYQDTKNDFFVSNYIIRKLVQAFPEAASMKDGHGRLPLFLALESGRTWNEVIQLLLIAYPDALWEFDTRSGLRPFMLASIAAQKRISALYFRQKDEEQIFYAEKFVENYDTDSSQDSSYVTFDSKQFTLPENIEFIVHHNIHDDEYDSVSMNEYLLNNIQISADQSSSNLSCEKGFLHCGENEECIDDQSQVEDELALEHLTTVFELLRACPTSITHH